MASCCGCCGNENDDAAFKNDEIFETEPSTSEMEYIDEFLESQPSSEISGTESPLNEEQPVNEKVTFLQAAPSAESWKRNLETIIPKFGYWNIRGLPFWIEGEVRISGATEIMEHIAEKHGMLPFEENPKKELREIDDEINDLRSAFEDFSNDADYVRAI
nr:hypothetical protein HmN_000366600 [Hymenolepis microstoma]